MLNKDLMQDFSGGPVGGNLSSNAGVMGSILVRELQIPRQGTKIPRAVGKQPGMQLEKALCTAMKTQCSQKQNKTWWTELKMYPLF